MGFLIPWSRIFFQPSHTDDHQINGRHVFRDTGSDFMNVADAQFLPYMGDKLLAFSETAGGVMIVPSHEANRFELVKVNAVGCSRIG